MEIVNEKTMKVVRIKYKEEALHQIQNEEKDKDDDHEIDTFLKQKLVINRLGLSVVNS
jgi:hypothetical protein